MREKSLIIHLKCHYFIQKLLLYPLLVALITPFFAQHYLMIICSIGLLFIVFTSNAFFRCLLKQHLFRCVSFLFIVEIFFRIVGMSTADIGNYALRFVIYSAVWASIFVHYYFDFDEQQSVLIFTNIIIYINIFYNIVLYSTHHELLGLSTTSPYFLMNYSHLNIANTAFYYLVEFQAVFFLCKTIYNKKGRLIYCVLCCISSYFIIRYSGSATITLTYLIFFLFAIFLANRNKNNIVIGTFLIAVFLLILYFLCILFSDVIINFLESIVGEKITTRIEVLLRFTSRKLMDDDYTYLSRVSFMELDIKTWFSSFKNFLIGKGYHTRAGESVLEQALANGDGGHSMMIDLLARYGLLGLLFDVVFIKSIFSYIHSWERENTKKTLYAVAILFLINNILNNCKEPAVCFLIIVFFPHIIDVFVDTRCRCNKKIK